MNFTTCRIMGGLGNYLFQISAAYALSIRDNKVFFCDVSDNITTHNHHQEYSNNIFRKIKFRNDLDNYKLFVENDDDIRYYEIPYIDGNVKIHGYFGSEKYFKKYGKEILDLFDIDNKTFDFLNQKYGQFIKNENTCSIHVRRGDYLKKQEYHEVQNIDYYRNAYNLMGTDKTYLIFSDDIRWCKENLNFIEKKVFIEDNKDYEDLYLMSLCKNNIIANSTFSWWGAWLNRNISKKIISPKNWYGPKYKHFSTNDIICDKWIIL